MTEPQVARETQRASLSDARYLVSTIGRWRALVAWGVAIIVAGTFVVLKLTPPDYRASTDLLLDQPALVANQQQGLSTAQKLAALMATYAKVATGDAVVDALQRVFPTESRSHLRDAISAAPIPGTLAIRLTSRASEPTFAERLARVAAAAFARSVAELETNGSLPSDARFATVPLVTPTAHQPPRHEGRAVLIAAGAGSILMAGVALVLESVDLF